LSIIPVIVAIADVAHYVTPSSALDREAGWERLRIECDFFSASVTASDGIIDLGMPGEDAFKDELPGLGTRTKHFDSFEGQPDDRVPGPGVQRVIVILSATTYSQH